MFWHDNRFVKTIPLSKGSNIALMRTAPGFSMMQAFCAEIASIPETVIDEAELLCMPTVTDDEDEAAFDADDEDEGEQFFAGHPTPRHHLDLPSEAFQQPAIAEEFQKDMTAAFESGAQMTRRQQSHLIEDDDVQFNNSQVDLIAWHYRLGHLSFERIKKLAERDDLPTYLMPAKTPRCSSCMYRKVTRQPWRTKVPVNGQMIPPVIAPGSVVGVDQLISSTPGLVGQMRGALTTKRYVVSTVFVDHFSKLFYVHLQGSTAADHTIKAKKAFER